MTEVRVHLLPGPGVSSSNANGMHAMGYRSLPARGLYRLGARSGLGEPQRQTIRLSTPGTQTISIATEVISPRAEAAQLVTRGMHGIGTAAHGEYLFDAAYGLRSVSLRYFNAAGADRDSEIGETHNPEIHLFPLVMETAAGRRASVEVFGDDYDTPDGTCIRDYIHVSDLADAHVSAMHRLLDGGYTHHFDRGNGDGFSVSEVIKSAERVTGRPIPKKVRPPRANDPPSLFSDAAKGREVLKWRPKRAALTTQLGDAWKWHHKMCHHEQERRLG